MHTKSFAVAQALGVAVSASIALPRAAAVAVFNPIESAYCASIALVATNFPLQSSSASAFCSSFFTISTSTTTTTRTTTSSATSTVNAVAYTTVTPTSTVYTSTQTCFTSSSTAANAKAKRTAAAEAAAIPFINPVGIFSAASSSYYSSACSCFGVNLHPTATSTVTATATTFVATITGSTGTSTVTAPAKTSSAIFTSFIAPSGQFVASDGKVYNEYAGFDFFGNDLERISCGAGDNATAANGQTFPCTGFTDCQNFCSEYNNNQGNTVIQRCVAVSYTEDNDYCYLKYAIDDCAPVMNTEVEGGLAIAST